jgi:hypothetical protein
MRPEELRERIRQAATNFTDEVIAIFGQAFTSVATDFSPRPVAAAPVAVKRGPGRSPRAQTAAVVAAPAPVAKKRNVAAKPVAAAPAPAAGKRIRRSTNDLDKAGDEVIQLLGAHKNGMRVEEINRALGTSTKELMRPIMKLLEGGQIRKQGERRATTYFVA